jgi:hypothetical protein
VANLAPGANPGAGALFLLILELFLDLFEIDRLHDRLEILNLQRSSAAGCLSLVFAVFALESCNRHGSLFLEGAKVVKEDGKTKLVFDFEGF